MKGGKDNKEGRKRKRERERQNVYGWEWESSRGGTFLCVYLSLSLGRLA